MRIETQIKTRDHAIGLIKCVFQGNHEWTQNHFQKYWHDIKQGMVLRKTPQTVVAFCQGYFEALFTKWQQERICFYYLVDGKFYTARREENPTIPNWNELPRDLWDTLSDKGGFYYKDTFKPFWPGE